VKVEGPKFRLWLAPDISVEERAEAAHALFRILIDPPRPLAERRRVAVRQALAQYQGARSTRAKEYCATNQPFGRPKARRWNCACVRVVRLTGEADTCGA
jgi:hypothetical protein